MKRTLIFFMAAMAIFSTVNCAKTVTDGPNEANKRFINAWMEVNHPGIDTTGLGVYILEEEEGSGIPVKEGGYVFVHYILTDLDGNIADFTDKETAKQLCEYDTTSYYGPRIWLAGKGDLMIGVVEAMKGMKVGGRKKVVIPSWLNTTDVYDTAEDYLKRESGNGNIIYDIRVTDFTEDITEWQIEQIGKYMAANPDTFKDITLADSLKVTVKDDEKIVDGEYTFKGMYYQQITPPSDTTVFPTDTTIYINYTGRFLDGRAFDTTNERIAKDNGLYTSSRSYEPSTVKWGKNYMDITLGGSSTIDGFALALWQMRSMEKGIAIFTSEWGYGTTGSSSSIPGYCPLIFEIEIVAKPEK